ncbi:hypothetical protein CPB83DRAFT_354259 [Crepidotus variabilis]|uniref:Uncharacterized protein n=1 Tax=Crepidotus variabilis TaxID=179855 RepID=A0A9P6JPK9_9AGAR|nr:hypothetical protein CPB83DRAFT_354259 [Crepidotus variabilis]
MYNHPPPISLSLYSGIAKMYHTPHSARHYPLSLFAPFCFSFCLVRLKIFSCLSLKLHSMHSLQQYSYKMSRSR